MVTLSISSPRRLVKNPSIIFAAALIAALMISSIVWILSDRRVWPWDQAWYGEVALDLWHAKLGGIGAWFDAMIHAFGAKPPLLAWLGQFLLPFRRLGIEIESALLLLNIAAAAGTLLCIYLLALRLAVAIVPGLVAVALCGGASLFIGLTHQFLVEILQCLTVAATMLVAWHARERPLVFTWSWAIILTAVGLLTKSSSILFVPPLLAYAVLTAAMARHGNRPETTRRQWGLAAVSLGIAAIAAAWYRVNWDQMLAHAVASTTGDNAFLYGSAAALPAKLEFWVASLATALAPFSIVGIFVGAIILWALAQTFSAKPAWPFREWLETAIESGTLFAFVLAGLVVATIFTYSLQINEETRFLAPLIPIIAVLLSWSLRSRPLLSAIFLVALTTNGLIAHVYAHGWNPLGIQPSPWLQPIHRDGNDAALLARAVRSTCEAGKQNRYVIVGVEYPALNANSAAFYSAKDQLTLGYRCFYTSLGYAEADPQRALVRIFEMNALYIVTLPPGKLSVRAADSFNRSSRPIAELLAHDPRFVLVSGSDEDLMIYRRVE